MTVHRLVYRAAILWAIVNWASTPAEAIPPPSYKITDLGVLGKVQSAGVAINSYGQVTGYSTVDGSVYQHAFIWNPTTPNGTSGTMHDLGTLDGNDSYGWDINDNGQITGTAGGMAYLWTPTTPNGSTGTMAPLGLASDRFVSGQGINNDGQVAGIAWITGTTFTGAHLWTPTNPNGSSGTIEFLGTAGGAYSQAYAINSGGQVVGESQTFNGFLAAFLWTPAMPNGNAGSMTNLGTFGGTYHSGARAVNDAGEVTGMANLASDVASHAFFYDGALHDLGTLGGNSSEGYGINSFASVTGYSQMPGNRVEHAFLWTSDTGMVDLNTLIDPLSGWELNIARDISDAGQITGYGRIGGQDHAFLLTPVPEPGAFSLLAVGLLGLAARLQRSRCEAARSHA